MTNYEFTLANQLNDELRGIVATIRKFQDKIDGPRGTRGEVIYRFLVSARAVLDAVDFSDLQQIAREKSGEHQ